MNIQNPGIEWTHPWGLPGRTWNPVGGCGHGCQWDTEDGIAECYAKTIAERFTRAYPHGFDHNYWRPHLLNAPLKLREPAGIFLDSMSDLMEKRVQAHHIKAVLNVCRRASHHVFFLLTKNAPRLLKFDIPPNVWVGVSTPPDYMHGSPLNQRQKTAYVKTMFKVLRRVEVPIRFISFEPLADDWSDFVDTDAIEWAIIGATSRRTKLYPPEISHHARLLKLLDAAAIPVFYKGNMKSLPAAVDDWREEYPTRESARMVA